MRARAACLPRIDESRSSPTSDTPERSHRTPRTPHHKPTITKTTSPPALRVASVAAGRPPLAAAARRRFAASARPSFAYGETASRTALLSPAAAVALAAATAAAAAAAASTGAAQASSSAAAAAAPSRAAAAADPNPYAPPPGSGARGRPSAVTLYQYEVCPFCCKVKAFLDYHRVPYEVVEVNPLTKAELKALAAEREAAAAAAAAAATGGDASAAAASPPPPPPPLKKVPVVKLAYADGGPEEVVSDSSVIISRLAAELGVGGQQQQQQQRRRWGGGGGGGGASDAEKEPEETRWRRWADERLVKTITANIYRSWDESWQTFSYITREAGDAWGWAAREGARVAGAVLMWRVGQGMPKKYGIEGDLREALYRDLDAFVDAVDGAKRPFLGGAAPNLGDLAVYGVISAIRGTNTYDDMVAHSRVKPWLERMDVAVGGEGRLAARKAGARAAAAAA